MTTGFCFLTIIDCLSEYLPCHAPALDLEREFLGVNLLPRRGEAFLPNRLYLCDAADLPQPLPAGVCFLALDEGGSRVPFPPDVPPVPMVTLQGSVDLAVVLNQVHELFIVLRHWVDNMRLIVSTGGALPSLLVLAENVLYNPIAVLDPGWKLLASTQAIAVDDPLFQGLLRRGYHSAEEIDTLRQSRFSTAIAQADGTVMKPPEEISRYAELIHVVRLGGVMAASVTMLCAHRPYTKGLAVLFDVLCFHITEALRRQGGPFQERHPWEYPLIDLLAGELTSEAVLTERLRDTGLSITGPFHLLRFDPRGDANAPPLVLLRILTQRLPHFSFFLFQDTVLALTTTNPVADSFSLMLEDHHLFCGVSNPFYRLMALPHAHTQCSAASRLAFTRHRRRALVKRGIAPDTTYPRLALYSDMVPYHMAECALRELPLEQLLSPSLLSLLGDESKSDVCDARILYVYLQCDRNMTHTAEALGMHRNNMIYRVGRLETKLGAGLDSPTLRRSLLASFAALELE